MFILGNFVKAIAVVLDMALTFYMWLIIIRAILSWVNLAGSIDPFNPIVRFINDVTDPVLNRIRSKMPNIQGVDLSPVVVIFAIIFMQIFIVENLKRISLSLM